MKKLPDVECWDIETREKYSKICKRWAEGNLKIEEVKSLINQLAWAISDLIPEPENKKHASSELAILIDDIMEMDSISGEEKDEAIMELYEMDKEELKYLAQKVIEQIEINHKEFLEEAEKRGYCPKLTKEQ